MAVACPAPSSIWISTFFGTTATGSAAEAQRDGGSPEPRRSSA